MLKLKLQYFGHPMRRADSLEDSDAGRKWGQEKGMTQDEMAGWHHGVDGHDSEWTPGDGDGQGGLACCDSLGRKESDTTERLNWTEDFILIRHCFICSPVTFFSSPSSFFFFFFNTYIPKCWVFSAVPHAMSLYVSVYCNILIPVTWMLCFQLTFPLW